MLFRSHPLDAVDANPSLAFDFVSSVVPIATDPVCVFHFLPSALSGVACLNILQSADRPRLGRRVGCELTQCR